MMSQKEKTEEEYYREADFGFSQLPSNFFKHRHIRLMLKSGTWVKIKRRINSPESLRRIMLKYKPKKSYFMVSRFLDPTAVGERNNGAALFLDQNIITFDIDKAPVKNARAIIKWLKTHGYELVYILFSGRRGLHVCVKRELKCSIANPTKRESWYLQQNQKLIAKMKASGLQFDLCILNTRQVVRVPMSISADTGYVCRFVSESELDSSTFEQIKEATPKVHCPGRPLKQANDCNRPSILQIEGSYTGLGSLNKNPQYCWITNNIMGSKGTLVPFLHLPTHDFNKAIEQFKEISRDLGDLYIYAGLRGTFAVGTRPIQRGALLKILEKYRQTGMMLKLKKYKHNMFWLTDLNFYLTKIPGKPTNHYSRSHANLLKHLRTDVELKPIAAGCETIPLYSW